MLFKNWLITGLSIALVVSHHLPNSRSSVIMNTKRRFKLEMQRVLMKQRILRMGYDSQEIFSVCDL
jgi:hypothetical protein